MKSFSTITLIAALLLSLATHGQEKQSVEIFFPTTGNCYFCKIRIEESVNKLYGVEAVLWDAGTDITTVTYNDAQVDAHTIMQTISNVGHETEWYPANDSAYASLEGTCCFYTKVIDYSNVQVGYLGLMGIWVSPLTAINDAIETGIQILPASGDGLYRVTGNPASPNMKMRYEVFTVNGQQVHTGQIAADGAEEINLRHLNSGCYIITLSNNNKIINSTKVFKN